MMQREYFEWLYNIVCGNRYNGDITYRKLLAQLHAVPFRYVIPKDRNRASDGLDLRNRAGLNVSGPCSVLEMMIALSIRCEEDYMDDPVMGNRTAQWFWNMITNLGLGDMYDNRYDERTVAKIIDIFLDRRYSSDGTGSLFKIRGCQYDMREVEIWHQMCWYLASIS